MPERPSVSPASVVVGRVAIVALTLAALAPAGCYWLRYHDLLLTHVDLMSGMAADAVAQVEATASASEDRPTRPLRPGDIERIGYPLERARQFIAVSEQRGSDRPSLGAFRIFVDAYAELAVYLDEVRTRRGEPGELARLRSLDEKTQQAASAVRAAAAAERAG